MFINLGFFFCQSFSVSLSASQKQEFRNFKIFYPHALWWFIFFTNLTRCRITRDQSPHTPVTTPSHDDGLGLQTLSQNKLCLPFFTRYSVSATAAGTSSGHVA